MTPEETHDLYQRVRHIKHTRPLPKVHRTLYTKTHIATRYFPFHAAANPPKFSTSYISPLAAAVDVDIALFVCVYRILPRRMICNRFLLRGIGRLDVEVRRQIARIARNGFVTRMHFWLIRCGLSWKP